MTLKAITREVIKKKTKDRITETVDAITTITITKTDQETTTMSFL